MARFRWWASLVLVHLIVVAALIMLSGCGLTPEGELLRAALREKGKTAAATGLENSEWYMCRAASIGSIKDRYGHVSDKVIAYNIICKNDPRFSPIIQLPEASTSSDNPL